MNKISNFESGKLPSEGLENRLYRPEVLFFDCNETMLDLNGMKSQVTKALGGRTDLMPLWFSTMLFHALVDTVTSNYHDFGTIGTASLQMIAEGNDIILDKNDAEKTMQAMKTIPVHIDVVPGLEKMKVAGFRMYTLTNSATIIMESQIKNAGIEQFFNGKLSTQGLNVYKPHPRTYRWAANEVGVPIEKCMLIAAHGWDVTGAKLAGMQAAFINRPGKTLYPLGPDVDLIARDMVDLVNELIKMPKNL